MPVGTLTSKGQITIPKEIRARLRLQSGQRLDFQLLDSGQVVVKPLTNDIRRLKGSVQPARRRPASLAEMDKAIAEGFAGR